MLHYVYIYILFTFQNNINYEKTNTFTAYSINIVFRE